MCYHCFENIIFSNLRIETHGFGDRPVCEISARMGFEWARVQPNGDIVCFIVILINKTLISNQRNWEISTDNISLTKQEDTKGGPWPRLLIAAGKTLQSRLPQALPGLLRGRPICRLLHLMLIQLLCSIGLRRAGCVLGILALLVVWILVLRAKALLHGLHLWYLRRSLVLVLLVHGVHRTQHRRDSLHRCCRRVDWDWVGLVPLLHSRLRISSPGHPAFSLGPSWVSTLERFGGNHRY